MTSKHNMWKDDTYLKNSGKNIEVNKKVECFYEGTGTVTSISNDTVYVKFKTSTPEEYSLSKWRENLLVLN